MRELPRQWRWSEPRTREEEIRFHDIGALHTGSRAGLQRARTEAAESWLCWHAQGESQRMGDSLHRAVSAKLYELNLRVMELKPRTYEQDRASFDFSVDRLCG